MNTPRNTTPDAPAPHYVLENWYIVLLTRYHPVERLARQWIAELGDPAARVYGLRVYHSFVAAYRRCWPRWPSYPRLVLNREAWGAAGFDEVAVATIAWVEWSEEVVVPGIVALRLLAEDLRAALSAAPSVVVAGPREALWRSEADAASTPWSRGPGAK